MEIYFRYARDVADIVPLLRTCSALACPAYRETLGRVIFDAWDRGGVPVVFSGSGCATEIVAAAEERILYDEQKPQSLARALQDTLHLNREQRTRLVNNGRSWMAKCCSPEIYAKAISTILSSASESHGYSS